MSDFREFNDAGTRRTAEDIHKDILLALRDRPKGLCFTHIIYKANLSHARTKAYLERLRSLEAVVEREREGKVKQKMYHLTSKGAQILSDIERRDKVFALMGLQ